MLTLTETKDAILALDTDRDILAQACRLILLDYPLAGQTAQQVAENILAIYGTRVKSSHDLLNALLAALASTAALSAKKEHEVSALLALQESFAKAYARALLTHIRAEAENDPAGGSSRLASILRQFQASSRGGM